MAKGKADVVFTLRTPFNQFYFNKHITILAHQQNRIHNEYLKNKITGGNLEQKMKQGLLVFSVKKCSSNHTEATTYSGRSTNTAIPVYEEGISTRYLRISIIALQHLSLNSYPLPFTNCKNRLLLRSLQLCFWSPESCGIAIQEKLLSSSI